MGRCARMGVLSLPLPLRVILCTLRTIQRHQLFIQIDSSLSASRQFYSLGTASRRSLVSGRQRTRGNSLQGKVGNLTNGRPQIGVTLGRPYVPCPRSPSVLCLHSRSPLGNARDHRRPQVSLLQQPRMCLCSRLETGAVS